ncbi:MAG: LCP family protein [Oscillospiraceae bacterium]|nr:LCP family protein [Oscillospiraceae bacterium]
MKITGSKRKAQHLSKNISDTTKVPPESFDKTEDNKIKGKTSIKKRIAVIVLSVIAIASVSIYFYIKTALSTRPPVKLEPRPDRPPLDDTVSPNPQTVANGEQALAAGNTVRDMAKYTFLLLATDAEGGNTDVIMVASFDTTDGKIDVVSIPRDTLVNVSWSLKKANSIYSNMRQRHGWEEKSLNDGMHATVETFADVLGFEVDYWVLVDMRAFVALVDAIDGVDFEIPVSMNYVDEAGGLSIHYSRGMQHLSGRQALEVLRYRAGYSDQDIGRINTQQSFLMSAASQILAKRSSLSVNELANIILKYVKTDIDLSSLIWFANQFLKINVDAIEFDVMPGNYHDWVGNQSYVTIYLDEWLELINEKLNPFIESVTSDSVSILTRGTDRYLYATDGNRRGDATWGQYSTGIISSSTTSTDSSTSSSSSSGGSGSEYQPPTSSTVPQASDSDVDEQVLDISEDEIDNEQNNELDELDDILENIDNYNDEGYVDSPTDEYFDSNGEIEDFANSDDDTNDEIPMIEYPIENHEEGPSDNLNTIDGGLSSHETEPSYE